MLGSRALPRLTVVFGLRSCIYHTILYRSGLEQAERLGRHIEGGHFMRGPIGAGAETAMSTARVEAFSDGVFAIAITLLVLGLRPLGAGRGLARDLAQQWPSYAAYVVSFGTIGIIWMNHSTLFGHLRRLDRPLVVANLLLLMVVAFIPFPTEFLASHVCLAGAR